MHPDVWCVDGNEAVADVAYRLSELAAIYPITPASPMGEWADVWSVEGRRNLWGGVPKVIEMQSEAGAAGVLHGALLGGTLATTFTSSQGLLLMLPVMYKIAGELLPCVFHVAARSLATHALSIFGDHSDVMATRASGFAMICSGSRQEAHDIAAISHAVTLRAQIPILHFFDGFRTSHELGPVERLSDEVLRALVTEESILEHRCRALNPERPVIRGTSQNPDVFFQSREAANSFYNGLPKLLREACAAFAEKTGRYYGLVEYEGDANATEVLVIMGSAGEAALRCLPALRRQGRRAGILRIRLYRPWPAADFLKALPETVRRVAVLDRTKEPGSFGEPLYLDVCATLQESGRPVQVCGGRYGIGGKEFTPAMVMAVFNHLAGDEPSPRFTVGIEDDITRLSLPIESSIPAEDPRTTRALFFGLGSDGTVGANRSSVRILSGIPGLHAQGYFIFDSNKSGSRTVSHLRFGPDPIRAPYLIQSANFIACHSFSFVGQVDLLSRAEAGATFLLNCPHPPERLFERLPREMVEDILRLRLNVWVIDARRVARLAGLGRHINTVMQACFFALNGVLPREAALEAIRASIRSVYGKKGEDVVARNLAAVDMALEHLREAPLPAAPPNGLPSAPLVPVAAPRFVREVTAPLLADKGDRLPVSALPADGSWPVGTAVYNRRDLSPVGPLWDPELCIQCGNCVVICPHGVIRTKQAAASDLTGAPAGFPAPALRGGEPDRYYLLHIHLPECTGCGLCIEICPAKSKTRANQRALVQVEKEPHLETNRAHLEFFLGIPARHEHTQSATVRGVQYLPHHFEFPGACAGCGETPALRLAAQLFGDRMIIANATGCSSIYGGNLPTTPWTTDAYGRGPAWANSLFEDNAEFGLGIRLAQNLQVREAEDLLLQFRRQGLDPGLVEELLAAPQDTAAEIAAQRRRLQSVLNWLEERDLPGANRFRSIHDCLVKRSVWIVGGDGWAYDIGFGGLDHVLSTGEDVNILVLDTEVYSNTGGQASKSTPMGAVAKFATAGKATPKMDLAVHAILKGGIYVATIALGAKPPQALRALREAAAWKGPSLVISHSPCIAHGYPLSQSIAQQTRAVESGYWPLFRYNPALLAQGKPALTMDSGTEPALALREYLQGELRFRLLELARPEQAGALTEEAEKAIRRRLGLLKMLEDQISA